MNYLIQSKMYIKVVKNAEKSAETKVEITFVCETNVGFMLRQRLRQNK